MWSVGISVSPCADAARIGYDERQINRIVIRMAQYFLDQNMCVIFGHDWREDGVMQSVADFAAVVAARCAETGEETPPRQRLDTMDNREHPRIINVVPTGQAPLSRTALAAQRDSGGFLEVLPVSRVNKRSRERVRELRALYGDQQHQDARVEELTDLRYFLTKLLNPGCRICLGGRTTGYEGTEPGVIEEARLALRFDKPLYLIGGFGGATRGFGEQPEYKGMDYWGKPNGLDKKRKRELFDTTDVERALRLIKAGIQAYSVPHEA